MSSEHLAVPTETSISAEGHGAHPVAVSVAGDVADQLLTFRSSRGWPLERTLAGVGSIAASTVSFLGILDVLPRTGSLPLELHAAALVGALLSAAAAFRFRILGPLRNVAHVPALLAMCLVGASLNPGASTFRVLGGALALYGASVAFLASWRGRPRPDRRLPRSRRRADGHSE